MKNHRATGATAVRRGSHRLLAPVIATLLTLTPAAAANADLSPNEQELRTEIMQLAYASQEHIFTSGGYLATMSRRGQTLQLGIDLASGANLSLYTHGGKQQLVTDGEGVSYREIPRRRHTDRALELLNRTGATHLSGPKGVEDLAPIMDWRDGLPGVVLEPQMLFPKVESIERVDTTPGSTTYRVAALGGCYSFHCGWGEIILDFRDGLLRRKVTQNGTVYHYDYGPQQFPLPASGTTVPVDEFAQAYWLAGDLHYLSRAAKSIARWSNRPIRRKSPAQPAKVILRVARMFVGPPEFTFIRVQRLGSRVTVYIDHDLAHDAWRLRWRPAKNKVVATHAGRWQP